MVDDPTGERFAVSPRVEYFGPFLLVLVIVVRNALFSPAAPLSVAVFFGPASTAPGGWGLRQQQLLCCFARRRSKETTQNKPKKTRIMNITD